ncbi:hypothetical protein Tco_0063666, partial [Tanacetum coccineum]
EDYQELSKVGSVTFGGSKGSISGKGIIFLEDKYVAEILKKFALVNVKAAITPMETKVTPKTSHLNAVKRIFKYLKGKPNLGLWYPRESPFDLEAFYDSDYGGSNLDRKSIIATANCCGQVLWIQNQLLDYGFNFMNTKIHIDNESTICIVKDPVYQLKYCDKHNQVGFLRKPDESTGFAEIVDFLRGSHLRYALTANPTIYDSLVKQFWQSAITNTKADGSLEINATIDTIRVSH